LPPLLFRHLSGARRCLAAAVAATVAAHVTVAVAAFGARRRHRVSEKAAVGWQVNTVFHADLVQTHASHALLVAQANHFAVEPDGRLAHLVCALFRRQIADDATHQHFMREDGRPPEHAVTVERTRAPGQPVGKREIDALRDVEAAVETAVVGARKRDDELARRLLQLIDGTRLRRRHEARWRHHGDCKDEGSLAG
jgi:hypothetical protein